MSASFGFCGQGAFRHPVKEDTTIGLSIGTIQAGTSWSMGNQSMQLMHKIA